MNCKTLIHPAQYETGTSQSQRVIDALLEGSAQLDGRTIADMLGYFIKFSRQINFYDEDGSIKDWQPFFRNSLPFVTASILNFRQDTFTRQLATYQRKFLRRPTKAGLDILVNYICTKLIGPFNTWDRQLQNSGLPISIVLDGLIKKTLRDQCRLFISRVNTAVNICHIRSVDFNTLLQPADAVGTWNFTNDDLTSVLSDADIKALGRTKRDRLITLYTAISGIVTPFLKAVNGATGAAGISLEQSFESLKDDLRKKHQPHLALIFAFLDLFRHLQDGLNGFTKKHLDFFYRQVLSFQPKAAVPDKAHIIFSIQKQLTSYKLAKGLTVKGPKDNNKADIGFALDDEIVVNQTQVTDLRTLFVNNQPLGAQTAIQGVYVAPVATNADGLTKPFKAGDPNSWPTVGARFSKYKDPITNVTQQYPNARLGLVLASPVLLLNEGTRTITITVHCTLKNTPDIYDPANLFTDLQQKASTAINLAFSGEKDWVIPQTVPTVTFDALTAADVFTMTITATLQMEDPAVTFYNKDALKEDLNTTLPAVRILLNDSIKLAATPTTDTRQDCCLRASTTQSAEVSLYHFFRDVVINDCNINVKVCGVKKFIVQNDESLQDVNKPIYPFGTRPTIIGFDRVTRVTPTPVILENAPAAAPAPTTLTPNLIGPNFYIGSQEVFGKKWKNVNINLNWKDKPSNFQDYYRGYWVNKNNDPNLPTYGLAEKDFQVNVSVLQKQNWIAEKTGAPFTTANTTTGGNNRELFQDDRAANATTPSTPAPVLNTCDRSGYQQSITLTNTSFDNFTPAFQIDPFTKYESSTQQGFIRLNLQNQDFLQKDYAYVLARQMMALGKLSGMTNGNTDQAKLEGAVYYDQNDEPVVFSTDQLGKDVVQSQTLIQDITTKTNNELAPNVPSNSRGIPEADADHLRYALYHPNAAADNRNFIDEVNQLKTNIDGDAQILSKTAKNFQAIIPNEPWTPIIQGISLDYEAEAVQTDLTLIHLYPYTGTYKAEDITKAPTLFPEHKEEGTLFMGLTGLIPGSSVNILFQLAEATSDTEEEQEPVEWSYLANNTWKPLRKGFEVLEDNTNDLSTTGIIKFALPDTISNNNTQMPGGLYWIKGAIGSNSGVVAESIAITTHAIQATFTDTTANDTQRLTNPLPANTLNKLEVADANVKKVEQPDDSFDGRVPETDGYFYVRVSETLRHKGRAIQVADYERLTLDTFPQVFKAKCISHSIGLNAHKYVNDYPMAPGHVLLAVIPDLNKLKASASYEPRVPLAMLDQIEQTIQKRTSPFVKLRAMNPRYEKVDFAIQAKLLPDKDENFYKQQLQDDIRQFMAPWAVGESAKLRFGQVVNRSDVIRFLETRDYLDYVIDWKWRHEEDDTITAPSPDLIEIFPLTPRSILIAGNIDITV